MLSANDILQGKILIVDDQEANVLLLKKMLLGAGYASITSTTDSFEVCELHLRNHYDLILLDLQMPGMDGFQVMENLKEIETGSYLPVLVITAQPDHKLRALEAGAKDFVSKPLDFAEVLIRVHNMLEVRLLHQQTKNLYQRVLAEQKASHLLLSSLLPGSIAELLRGHAAVTPESPVELVLESHAEVTVLFASIMEFTKFSEGASAEVLERALHDIASRFGSDTESLDPERSKVMGDAYLACVGMQDPLAERTVLATQKALDLAEALDRFNAHSRLKLRVQIGMEAGKVVAGRVSQRFTLSEV